MPLKKYDHTLVNGVYNRMILDYLIKVVMEEVTVKVWITYEAAVNASYTVFYSIH